MEHKGTKTIETERLTLRPFRAEDAEAMFRNWASDPEVTKFLTWPAHGDVSVTRHVLADWVGRYGESSYYQWAIELKEIREPIGSISIVKSSDETESATIGYCIGRRFWGQGITAEALEAVMAYLFEEVGMNCVTAGGINNQGRCDERWYSILKAEYDRRGDAEEIWKELYEKALAVQNGRKISNYVDAGGVAAAILTASGNIYTGVCVETCSTLGICAERNAMFNMLTNGEHEIRKVLAIMPDGRTGAPCGACRELMAQLMPDSYRDIEVMLDYERKRTATLGELTPEWWI